MVISKIVLSKKNIGGIDMIDTKHYTLLDSNEYSNKSDAYDVIRLCYSHLNGVTTYYDNGLWYIVQSNALMWNCQTKLGGGERMFFLSFRHNLNVIKFYWKLLILWTTNYNFYSWFKVSFLRFFSKNSLFFSPYN